MLHFDGEVSLDGPEGCSLKLRGQDDVLTIWIKDFHAARLLLRTNGLTQVLSKAGPGAEWLGRSGVSFAVQIGDRTVFTTRGPGRVILKLARYLEEI